MSTNTMMNSTQVTQPQPGDTVYLSVDFNLAKINQHDYTNPQNFKKYLDDACMEYEETIAIMKKLRSDLTEMDNNNAKMILRSKKYDSQLKDSFLVYRDPYPQLHSVIHLKIAINQGGYDDYVDRYCNSKLTYLQDVAKNE